jgi:magnesium transporter
MLRTYAEENFRLVEVPAMAEAQRLVWIDMLEPSDEEEAFVESLIGIEIPTRDEQHDIEISSSLYQEKGAVYATASLVVQNEDMEPEIHRVSFILSDKVLITLRYVDPKSFRNFTAKVQVTPSECQTGPKIMIQLLEVIIARLADILEQATHAIDNTSKQVFHRPQTVKKKRKKLPSASTIDFEDMLNQIGTTGDLISKISESLVSFARLTGYLEQTPVYREHTHDRHHLDVILKDLISLRDYSDSLSDKITFLLDATLGMIGIEQSNIIKIFSVAAVLFLPPTLIASIYGMNFAHMPELIMPWGYPFAIVLMAAAAWLPYRYFRKKGWL